MATITTKLVKDGNSAAVRLPKHVLTVSGLCGNIQMEVKKGRVILRTATTPREGWSEQISRVVADNPKAALLDSELTAWDSTLADGLNETY